ncbi:SMU1 [Symbiodinium sp. CCMP2592]|nr:SMU1 [Symbiodinium sp. CCMP2592]
MSSTTSATVDSADIVRLNKEFCKENSLFRTLQCLQEESRVSLNAVDSLDALLSDVNKGHWDTVLQAVSYLSLPPNVLQDLYSQVVLELAELREVETAHHLLRETAPMNALKQANPERYLRVEALVKKHHFDASEAYEGMSKEKIRGNLAQSISKHVQVAPPSRLLALVGQAMKWQQHVGLLPKNARIDVFRGVAKDAEVEAEMCPTMVARTVKFGSKSHPECVTFSPDGQFCVSGSVDGMVEVWDHQTGTLRKDLQYQDEGSFMMHDKAVIAVAFNKESELLATGSQDGQIKVWRIATGQCARRYEKAHNQGITCITWAKDSSQLLTGSFDFTARVHGIKSGKTLKEFRGHKSYVNSAVYTKDNARVVTASSDSHVIVYDAKTTEIINTITPPPPSHCSSIMDYSVNAAIMAPKIPGYSEHEDLVFVCTRTNTILLMNLAGQVLKSFCSGKRDKGDFVAMTTSPKGEWLYGVAEDNTMYCFSVSSGSLEQTLKVADKEVIGIAHHPSRNVIAGFAGDGSMVFMSDSRSRREGPDISRSIYVNKDPADTAVGLSPGAQSDDCYEVPQETPPMRKGREQRQSSMSRSRSSRGGGFCGCDPPEATCTDNFSSHPLLFQLMPVCFGKFLILNIATGRSRTSLGHSPGAYESIEQRMSVIMIVSAS